MIREPVVAGQFYPASPAQLSREVREMLEEDALREEAIGAVLPHAGYIYSGAVAGATISRIKFKKTFIIIGPSHTGRGKPFSVVSEGSFRTPLGEVKINSRLAKALLKNSVYLEEDFRAHQYEHSIEVQLPFLQVINKDVEIIPIVLSYSLEPVYAEIGREIAKTLEAGKEEVVLLASSDMTHYEPHEVAGKKDRQAIESILKLDEQELGQRVEELNITMCGWMPVICLLSAAKALGARKASLVRYQTSGEVSGDFSSVVGYAGILIHK